MDYTKNEVKDLHVRGFPTIKLFGPKLPNGLNYDGERKVKELI